MGIKPCTGFVAFWHAIYPSILTNFSDVFFYKRLHNQIKRRAFRWQFVQRSRITIAGNEFVYNDVDISHFQCYRCWSDATIYYILKMSTCIQRSDNKHPNEHFQFIFPQKYTDSAGYCSCLLNLLASSQYLVARTSVFIALGRFGSVGDNIITSLCGSWLILFQMKP